MIHYLEKLTDEIEDLLQKQEKDFAMEDFHRLRVSIKKLRAIGGMCNKIVKHFKKNKIFDPLDKIFAAAGEIREVQLEKKTIIRLTKNDKLPVYMSSLENRNNKAGKKFFSLKGKKISKEIKNGINKISTAAKGIGNGKADKYIQQRKARLSKLTAAKPTKDKLHKFRKRLKQYYYLLKFLKIKTGIAKQKIDTLQELLGKWHDENVIYTSLGEAINTIEEKAELAVLSKTRTEVLSESRILNKKIQNILKQLEL